MVQNFRFHRTLVWHFVHQWGVYLGFTALRHNPLSVCRNTKIKQNCICKIVVRRIQDVRCMTSITPCAEEKEDFVCLRRSYGFPNPILFDYKSQYNFNYLEPALTPFFVCYKPLSQPPISLSERRTSLCVLTFVLIQCTRKVKYCLHQSYVWPSSREG